jgi:hypothetical protein
MLDLSRSKSCSIPPPIYISVDYRTLINLTEDTEEDGSRAREGDTTGEEEEGETTEDEEDHGSWCGFVCWG